MNKWILAAALVAFAAAPAQAHRAKPHHAKSHHRKPHHAHAAAVTYPESVTLEGKEYKVCRPGYQDDCVQPSDARLHPGKTHHRH